MTDADTSQGDATDADTSQGDAMEANAICSDAVDEDAFDEEGYDDEVTFKQDLLDAEASETGSQSKRSTPTKLAR